MKSPFELPHGSSPEASTVLGSSPPSSLSPTSVLSPPSSPPSSSPTRGAGWRTRFESVDANHTAKNRLAAKEKQAAAVAAAHKNAQDTANKKAAAAAIKYVWRPDSLAIGNSDVWRDPEDAVRMSYRKNADCNMVHVKTGKVTHVPFRNSRMLNGFRPYYFRDFKFVGFGYSDERKQFVPSGQHVSGGSFLPKPGLTYREPKNVDEIKPLSQSDLGWPSNHPDMVIAEGYIGQRMVFDYEPAFGGPAARGGFERKVTLPILVEEALKIASPQRSLQA